MFCMFSYESVASGALILSLCTIVTDVINKLFFFNIS